MQPFKLLFPTCFAVVVGCSTTTKHYEIVVRTPGPAVGLALAPLDRREESPMVWLTSSTPGSVNQMVPCAVRLRACVGDPIGYFDGTTLTLHGQDHSLDQVQLLDGPIVEVCVHPGSNDCLRLDFVNEDWRWKARPVEYMLFDDYGRGRKPFRRADANTARALFLAVVLEIDRQWPGSTIGEPLDHPIGVVAETHPARPKGEPTTLHFTAADNGQLHFGAPCWPEDRRCDPGPVIGTYDKHGVTVDGVDYTFECWQTVWLGGSAMCPPNQPKTCVIRNHSQGLIAPSQAGFSGRLVDTGWPEPIRTGLRSEAALLALAIELFLD